MPSLWQLGPLLPAVLPEKMLAGSVLLNVALPPFCELTYTAPPFCEVGAAAGGKGRAGWVGGSGVSGRMQQGVARRGAARRQRGGAARTRPAEFSVKEQLLNVALPLLSTYTAPPYCEVGGAAGRKGPAGWGGAAA